MNMLDPVTNETIYASNGCDEIPDSEDTGNEDINDDNNLESNIRRRKGKIISCAKETIEQGKNMHGIDDALNAKINKWSAKF